MSDAKNRICPVERAGGLDNGIRRWLQNPRKILAPYVDRGMTVLDVGCGPGFFSIELARMVGESGRVIASDLQEGMLRKLQDKIEGTELEKRIVPHKCEQDKIGVAEKVDFVLAFYMVHEIPDQGAFFKEIASILKPDGRIFLAEPSFHVSKKAFEETIRKAGDAGLTPVERPRVFFSRAVVLREVS
jgi:ubiquinone/menaquinone biosynthesis C-methylase UbiE